jgi:hypothetical protein
MCQIQGTEGRGEGGKGEGSSTGKWVKGGREREEIKRLEMEGGRVREDAKWGGRDKLGKEKGRERGGGRQARGKMGKWESQG